MPVGAMPHMPQLIILWTPLREDLPAWILIRVN
jgi:hypothetical protein